MVMDGWKASCSSDGKLLLQVGRVEVQRRCQAQAQSNVGRQLATGLRSTNHAVALASPSPHSLSPLLFSLIVMSSNLLICTTTHAGRQQEERTQRQAQGTGAHGTGGPEPAPFLGSQAVQQAGGQHPAFPRHQDCI